MNMQLSPEELATLPVAIPILSRKDKLLRLAQVIRESGRDFYIFHRLEYMTPEQLAAAYHPLSAFTAAASDSTLSSAGLAGVSVGDAQKFFELSRDDLHAFSCDCGGGITNENMARRIEAIANRR